MGSFRKEKNARENSSVLGNIPEFSLSSFCPSSSHCLFPPSCPCTSLTTFNYHFLFISFLHSCLLLHSCMPFLTPFSSPSFQYFLPSLFTLLPIYHFSYLLSHLFSFQPSQYLFSFFIFSSVLHSLAHFFAFVLPSLILFCPQPSFLTVLPYFLFFLLTLYLPSLITKPSSFLPSFHIYLTSLHFVVLSACLLFILLAFLLSLMPTLYI